MTYFQKKIYKVTTWYWVECHEKNMYHAVSSAQILVKYKITKFKILGNIHDYNSKLKKQAQETCLSPNATGCPRTLLDSLFLHTVIIVKLTKDFLEI